MKPALLSWLDAPSDAGIHFADEEGWGCRGYAELAGRVRRVAAGLRQRGVQPGDVVALVFYGGEQFVEALFGVFAVGAVASPLAPPVVFRGKEEYERHLRPLLDSAAPKIVVCEDALAAVLPEMRTVRHAPMVTVTQLAVDVELDVATERQDHDPALLQFTSGSSGTPQGVQISWANLEANVDGIRRWLRMGASDGTATWLPIYHDMGLIGCLLTPVANGSDVWVMRPDQFIRDPVRWLQCFGDGRAVLTASPNFGYAYAMKRVSVQTLEGQDFSGWRTCIVGAERVDPAGLHRFSRFLAPFGFSPTAFLPAYGLAEATLAVTGHQGAIAATALRVELDKVRIGEVVPVSDSATIADEAVLEGEGWLVACGSPHAGADTWIADEDGRPLPEGHLGEIVVRGTSVGRMAHDAERESGTRWLEGGLHTSDAGFVHDGQLYVLGRMGDSLNVRGRRVFAEQVEARLQALPGVPTGRVVVVGDVLGFAAIALVEQEEGEWLAEAAKVLEREVGGGPVRIYAVPKGTVPRTSSGKPRRRVLWRQLLERGAPDRLPA